jgi:hypothetical protein
MAISDNIQLLLIQVRRNMVTSTHCRKEHGAARHGDPAQTTPKNFLVDLRNVGRPMTHSNACLVGPKLVLDKQSQIDAWQMTFKLSNFGQGQHN